MMLFIILIAEDNNLVYFQNSELLMCDLLRMQVVDVQMFVCSTICLKKVKHQTNI